MIVKIYASKDNVNRIKRHSQNMRNKMILYRNSIPGSIHKILKQDCRWNVFTSSFTRAKIYMQSK